MMKLSMRYLVFVTAVVLLSTTSVAWSRDQPPFIEDLLRGEDAIVVAGDGGKDAPVVTLGRRFGGSVVSLYYRGVEYVNNESNRQVDYGRQLQSAVQYRDAGECFNPTEAGGRYDRGHAASSSRLLSVERPKANVVVTRTDMAFWMAPGQEKTKKGKECAALNTQSRAGYFLERTLQVGVEGYSNVIAYNTKFIAPVVETAPRYVPVVIHTPTAFTRIFRVNADGSTVEVAGKRNERGPLPYAQATADQRHAVVVCAAKPSGEYFYGYTRFSNTTTSRFVAFAAGAERESPLFENFVIVGSLAEVGAASSKFCFRR